MEAREDSDPFRIGDIHLLSSGGIDQLSVVNKVSDQRYLALKVSPFWEFALSGDLMIQGQGARYVALPDNQFAIRQASTG
jgi:uncharacterized protein (DUF1501 family)